MTSELERIWREYADQNARSSSVERGAIYLRKMRVIEDTLGYTPKRNPTYLYAVEEHDTEAYRDLDGPDYCAQPTTLFLTADEAIEVAQALVQKLEGEFGPRDDTDLGSWSENEEHEGESRPYFRWLCEGMGWFVAVVRHPVA